MSDSLLPRSASSERVTIPALRDEIHARRYGDKIFVEDTARMVRMQADALTIGILQELAEGPRTPRALIEALEAPAIEVFERVAKLNRHVMLASKRGLAMAALAKAERGSAPPREALAEAEVFLPPDLTHTCQGTGSCCTSNDLGPLKDDDIERVASIPPESCAQAPLPDGLFYETHQVEGHPEPVRLLARHEDRCVFLGEDQLCAIHKAFGGARKPTLCSHFPLVLVRTPRGIDVSIDMACSGWAESRKHRPADEGRIAEVRRLVAEGGSMLSLPTPVPVWDGVDMSLAQYSALQDAVLEEVAGAESFGDLIERVSTAVLAHVRAALAPFADGEAFAERAGWGLPAPPAGGGLNFLERSRVVSRCMQDFLGKKRAWDARREDAIGVRRHARLAASIEALLAGQPEPACAPAEGELEMARDLVKSAVYGHDLARRGGVLVGLAIVNLRLLAGRRRAAEAAREGMRARRSAQDVVDNMVAITKMLRGVGLDASIASQRAALVDVFGVNAGVFATGRAPRVTSAALGMRLSGF